MKALFLSGGATRIIGLLSAAKELDEMGFKPDIIGGVSAGAIASVPIAMGLYDKAIQIVNCITLDDIFDIKPVSDKGTLTFKAISRALTGKKSLGIQNIRGLIKRLISKEVFEQYQKGDYPTITVMAVNARTGQRKYWSLKNPNLTYETYLTAIEASSHMPVFSQPVEYKGELYYDGGIRDHIPSYLLLKAEPEVEEVVSIYTRPNYTGIDPDFKFDKNLYTVFVRLLHIYGDETSFTDQKLETEYCLNNGIKLTQVFMPRIMRHDFDLNQGRLNQLRHEAGESAREAYNPTDGDI